MARQTVQISTSVGQQIQEARIRLGWSMKDLARVSDVSTKWISSVENNHVSSIDVVLFNRVTSELGLTPNDLFCDTDQGMNQEPNCRYQAWTEDRAIPALTMALFQPDSMVALTALVALKAIGTREATKATRFFCQSTPYFFSAMACKKTTIIRTNLCQTDLPNPPLPITLHHSQRRSTGCEVRIH